MKLQPCLAEPILALHPHELTPPLSPNPVFSCFISAPSPERGGGAPGSAPGPDAADNPQAMRPRDRAGHSAASHLAEATVAAVTSDDPEADPEAVPVPREGVAVYVAPSTQR